MKRNVFTRITSAFLAFVMVFLMIPASVFSAFADALQGISGKRWEQSSVFVYDAEDLNAIRNDLDGTYILMNDIDLSKYEDWVPIGSPETPFTGNLLGAGYTISGLQITTLPETENGEFAYVGLFGYNAGCIRDVRLEGSVQVDPAGTNAYLGSLAAYNSGRIINCYDGVNYKNYTVAENALYAGIKDLDAVSAQSFVLGKSYALTLKGSGQTYSGFSITVEQSDLPSVYIFLQNVNLTDFSLDAGATTQDIYIISQGTSNSIKAKMDTIAINAPNARVFFVGDAPLTVRGGDGSTKKVVLAAGAKGVDGNSGQLALQAKSLIVSMHAADTLMLYGGNGGNATAGATGSNASFMGTGGNGGIGGKGGDGASAFHVEAVVAMTALIATSGNGGAGGQGGKGGNAGMGDAGFAGNGGNGGNTAVPAIYSKLSGCLQSIVGTVGNGGASNKGGTATIGKDRDNVSSNPGASGSIPEECSWKSRVIDTVKGKVITTALDDTVVEETVDIVIPAASPMQFYGYYTVDATVSHAGEHLSTDYPTDITNGATMESGDYAYYIGTKENPYAVLLAASSKSTTACHINEKTEYIYFGAFGGCRELKAIKIPENVRGIGPRAFYDCQKLTQVITLAPLNEIARYAFAECIMLSDITLVDHNEQLRIGQNAFQNCTSLGNISIPEGTTEIGAYAFSGAKKLKEIVIPKGVEKIEAHTFEGCEKLANVTFAKGSKVLSIGDSAFANCISLQAIDLPTELMTIGTFAFANNVSLKSLHIPAKVSSVASAGVGSFYGCSSLETITVAAENTVYGSFDSNCLVEIESKTVILGSQGSNLRRSGATQIAEYAFMGIYFNQPLEIPEGMSIATAESGEGEEATAHPVFVDCGGEFILLSAEVGKDAFSGCDEALYYAYEGNSIWEESGLTVQKIEDHGGCGTDARYVLIGTNEAYYEKTLGVLLCYGDGTISGFSAKGETSYHKYTSDKLGICIKEAIISNGIDAIGENAFVKFELLVSIRFGKDIQKLEQHSVYNNTLLSSLFFEGDCPEIHKNAFHRELDNGDGEKETYSNDSHLKITYDIDTHGWSYNGKPYQSFVPGEGFSTASYEEGSSYLVTTDADLTPIDRNNTDRYGIEYELQYDPADPKTPIAALVSGYNSQISRDKDVVISKKILSGTTAIPVIGIAPSAFEQETDIATVTITTPTAENAGGITSIGANAFKGCTAQIYFVGDAIADVAAGAFDAGSYVVVNQGTEGWSEKLDNAKVYSSAILTGNQDKNGVYYTVDLKNNTAIVGKKSSLNDEEITVNTSNATLREVVIPTFVTYNNRLYKVVGFDRYAFYGNKLMESVEFGRFVGEGQSEELPAIWDCTFRNTERLQAITVHAENPDYKSVSGVLYGNPLTPEEDEAIFTRLLKYPEGKTDASFTPASKVTVIENYAFAANEYLTGITLTDVNVIGSHAFWNCTALKDLFGSYQIHSIGDSAFENTAVQAFQYSETLANIGVRAFYNSGLVGPQLINHNVIFIGDGAFGRCTEITAFAFHDYSDTDRTSVLKQNATDNYRVDLLNEAGTYGVLFDDTQANAPVLLQYAASFEQTAGKAVVYDMSADDVQQVPYKIASEAFWGARNLKSLTLNDATVLVGSQAFANCAKLEYVKLGAGYYGSSNTEASGLYSYNLFVDSPALDFIEVSVNNQNFSNDSNGVLYSKDRTVLYCYPAGIQRVSYTVPASVVKIYDSAFYGNTNVKQIVVGTTKQLSIGSRAFGSCTNLNTVYYVSEFLPKVGEKIYDNTPESLYTRFKVGFEANWLGEDAENATKEQLWCERKIGSYEMVTDVPNDTVQTNDYLLFVKGTDGSALTDVYFIITVYGIDFYDNPETGEEEMVWVPHKFYLYADELGRVNFSSLMGSETIRSMIHVYAQKEGYYTYDQDMYIDLDMLISYLTMTQEPDVFGVSCGDKDINSQTADLNIALYRETYSYTVQNADGSKKETVKTVYEDVTIKVLGFWDPACTNPVFTLIQNGTELPAKTEVDGNNCTFTVSASHLKKDLPIEVRVAVQNGPDEILECRKVLNINVIDFELDSDDVNLSFGDMISLEKGPEIFKQLFGSAELEIELTDEVSIKTEINDSQVILSVTAKTPDPDSNAEKGYKKFAKPHNKGSFFYQFFDGTFTYNIRFVQSEAENYYYYSLNVYLGVPGGSLGEVIKEYGAVNLSPYEHQMLIGRERVALRALTIFHSTRQAIIEAVGSTFDDTLDINKLLEGPLKDFEAPYEGYVPLKNDGNSQVSNKHKFGASIEGQLVFEYSKDEGIHLASGSIKGEIKYTFKHNSQYVVWSIPVILEVEVTLKGELNLKLRFDDESAPISLDELSIRLEAELKASLGIGCSIASIGLYGSVGTVIVFDIFPSAADDSAGVRYWEIHGDFGAYVKVLWYTHKVSIWSGKEYLIGEPQSAKFAAYRFARAAMFLDENYVYSNDCEENAHVVSFGDKYYKVYFARVSGGEYDEYNCTKLVVAKWNGSDWEEPAILDVGDSYSDAAYTLFADESNVYIAYTHQTKKLTEETVNNTEIGAEGLSLKWVALSAAEMESVATGMTTANVQTVIDGTVNGAYKYAHQIGMINGKPALAWAENSDNNIFGVSPDNYYDKASDELHVYETTANSIHAYYWDGSAWKTTILQQGLSSVVDLAVDGDDIYYVVDRDGDLADGSDCTLMQIKDLAVGAATEIGLANSVEVQNGTVLYYSTEAATEGLHAYEEEWNLPDVTTMLNDGYVALYDSNKQLDAILYAEILTWEEYGETVSATAIKGIFREGDAWGAPVTVYEPEMAGCYISSFDAAYVGSKLMITMQICNSDGVTLSCETLLKDLYEVDFDYTYHIDYKNQKVICTVTNKGAKTATFAVGESAISKQIRSGMSEEFELSPKAFVCELSVTAQSADGKYSLTLPEGDPESISTAYVDMRPHVKQMVVGEKNTLMIAIRNRGNLAASDSLKFYVLNGSMGNSQDAQVGVDDDALQALLSKKVYVGSVKAGQTVEAGGVLYYELTLDDSVLANGNGVISIYVEAGENEPEEFLADNLTAIYLSEISQTIDETIEDADPVTPEVSIDTNLFFKDSGELDVQISAIADFGMYTIVGEDALSAIPNVLLRMNGEALDESFYSVQQVGNYLQTVTLFAEKLEQLEAGSYTFEVLIGDDLIGSVTLKITEVIITYTYKWFDSDGSLLEVITSTNSSVAPNVVPQKAGYTFVGWSDAFYGQKPGGSGEMVDDETVICYTAQYQKKEAPATYQITWILSDTQKMVRTFTEGDALSAPARIFGGLIIRGWDANGDGVADVLGTVNSATPTEYRALFADNGSVYEFTIKGVSAVGMYLEADLSKLPFADDAERMAKLKFQWYADGVAIEADGTESILYLTQAMQGKNVWLVVIDTEWVGTSNAYLVSKHQHTTFYHAAQAPTCEYSGNREYWYCQICDTYYADVNCSEQISPEALIIPAKGHSYQDAVTPPTCTAEGFTTHVCAHCGNTYVDTPVAKTEHVSGEWIIDLPADCTHDGTRHRTCVDCDVLLESQTIQKTGHSYQSTVLPPTCTAKGYTEHVCSVCQHTYRDTEVAVTAHTMLDWVVKTAPNCTDNGVQTRACAHCSYSETQIIPKLGHSFEETWTVDKAATCTGIGFESRHCTACDATTDQREIARLAHDFGAWTQTKKPNCTEDGSERRDCADCDHYETRVLTKLGHSFEETWTVDKAATCTGIGFESRHCTACDATTDQREISQNPHNFGTWTQTKKPNCTEDGSERRDCADCEHYEIRTVTKLGHSFEDAWTVDQEATCAHVGSESRHCTACEATTDRREIAKKEHTYDDGKVTLAPSANSVGVKTYTCSGCAHAYTEEIAKIAPTIVEQSTTVWEEWGGEGTIQFRSNASYEDFVEVRLNGEVLPADCYTLREGSIIVELAPAYLDSLGNGDYKVEIVSKHGVAETAFSVNKNVIANPWLYVPVISVVSVGVLAAAIWFVFFKKKLFVLTKNF